MLYNFVQCTYFYKLIFFNSLVIFALNGSFEEAYNALIGHFPKFILVFHKLSFYQITSQ